MMQEVILWVAQKPSINENKVWNKNRQESIKKTYLQKIVCVTLFMVQAEKNAKIAKIHKNQSNIIIILMWKQILVATVLVLGLSQNVGLIVGGYKPYTDLQSSQFQQVLSFLYSQHPQLANNKILSVERQLVNGFNYRLTLEIAPSCNFQVTVYSSFQGDMNIPPYAMPMCLQLPPTVIDPILIPTPTPITGGYKTKVSPSGPEFEWALSQALSENSQLSRSNLILTQTQVVNGINYRFTFKNADGTTTQSIIFVPIGFNPDAPIQITQPVVLTGPQIGGYTDETDQTKINDALSAVYSKFDGYGSYKVVSVKKQVVSGVNYLVDLSNSDANSVSQVEFKVYVDLKGTKTVTKISETLVKGSYTHDSIEQIKKQSVALHPELQGAQFVKAENIWASGQGLKLSYILGDKNYTVFAYTNKGKEVNLIF